MQYICIGEIKKRRYSNSIKRLDGQFFLSHFGKCTKIKFHVHHPTFASNSLLKITDSDGYVLYSRKNATKGRFSFTTENPVVFDVCFLSRSPMGE